MFRSSLSSLLSPRPTLRFKSWDRHAPFFIDSSFLPSMHFSSNETTSRLPHLFWHQWCCSDDDVALPELQELAKIKVSFRMKPFQRRLQIWDMHLVRCSSTLIYTVKRIKWSLKRIKQDQSSKCEKISENLLEIEYVIPIGTSLVVCEWNLWSHFCIYDPHAFLLLWLSRLETTCKTVHVQLFQSFFSELSASLVNPQLPGNAAQPGVRRFHGATSQAQPAPPPGWMPPG